MRYLLLFCLALRLGAASYFVDLDAGSDSNDGTSTGTAWRTIPGTRNSGDTAYVVSAWGSITTGNKVAAGDTINLKSGTTLTSGEGGRMNVTTDYYSSSATLANPITIKRDTSWGSGSTTFDGTSITLAGAGELCGQIYINVAGVKVDGNGGTNGFVFKHSPKDGVASEPASNIEGPSVYSCYFTNCGTLYASSEETTEGSIRIKRGHSGEIFNCSMDGNGNKFQGICFGDGSRHVWNYTVSNCFALRFSGNNDAGIGFKAFNSQITFINSKANNCYKGFDLGESSGANSNILYKVIGCETVNSTNGINMSGFGGASYTGTVNFYIINCIVRDAPEAGSRIYAGPFNAYVIGTVYDNCGGSAFGTGSLGITPDNSVNPDLSVVRAYVYNTILYKPSSTYCNLFVENYAQNTNDFELDSNYNSWVQRASEEAVYWSQLNANPPPGPNAVTFAYGANGPGKTSGNWYSWYSYNTTAPSSGGNGHFHADANSKGTGATDTTLPPFTDVVNHDYTLTTNYAGTDISGKPWFISEMGKDKNGTTRTTWDIGAFEFTGAGSSVKAGFRGSVGRR